MRFASNTISEQLYKIDTLVSDLDRLIEKETKKYDEYVEKAAFSKSEIDRGKRIKAKLIELFV